MNETKSRWPSVWYWLLPLGVGLLRTLPYVWSLVTTPPAGGAVVAVGYVPADFLSYVAFIRQSAEGTGLLLHDPFTTDAHPGRFILMLHWALGQVSWFTGASATTVLELSRLPLTFAFFAVLWWFLGSIFPRPRDRTWTAVMIGLSGGIEGFLKPLTYLAPEFVRTRFTEGVWHLYGWNTFESLYNPLWIVGLTLTLVVLRPALAPRGPQTKWDFALLGLGFPLLFFVHPYSALVALAVIAARPVVELVLAPKRFDWSVQGRTAAALAVPLAAAWTISRWQSGDPVYRAASANVMGKLQLAVFWYPLTLGAVGVLAARGAQRWWRQRHAFGLSLLGWLGAVVLLHTSPIVNGYHFVFHLHLPLCLLAGPAARIAWRRWITGRAAQPMAQIGLLGAALASFVLVTAESVGDIGRRNCMPQDYAAVVETLAELPAGKVMADPQLGNLIPAYTSHRVWVGHWFLTPGYHQRSAEWKGWLAEESSPASLVDAAARHEIRYLVVPTPVADRLQEAMPAAVQQSIGRGNLSILVVDHGVAEIELVQSEAGP